VLLAVLSWTGGARASAAASSRTAGGCLSPPQGPLTAPTDDPFYSAPEPLPVGVPGTVIRSRPICVASPTIELPYEAWQLMYLSTGAEDAAGAISDDHAVPTVDIATIVVPLTPFVDGSRPLVSYQVAEDADSELSAPSYMLRQPSPRFDQELWVQFLSQGIAVVIPDFEGLASEQMAGTQNAHAVLDAIRAAEQFAPAQLGGDATAVGLWGYSGGAFATGWASELAASYAPELHIEGVAEGGVPADLKELLDDLNATPFASLPIGALVGTAIAYPNFFYDEAPDPGNDEIGGADRTGIDTVFNTLGQSLVDTYRSGGSAPYYANIDTYTWCGCNPLNHALEFPGIADLIALDDLGQPGHVPNAPAYIYEAYFDELIPYPGVQRLVDTYCDEDADAVFRVDYASEHITLAVTGSSAALGFLTLRFEGRNLPTTCPLPFHGGAPVNPPLYGSPMVKA
jgi:hypothetical protein